MSFYIKLPQLQRIVSLGFKQILNKIRLKSIALLVWERFVLSAFLKLILVFYPGDLMRGL